MSQDERSLKDIASKLKSDGMQCNCDLDNWQPENSTGHSLVCRIHKTAERIKYHPNELTSAK